MMTKQDIAAIARGIMPAVLTYVHEIRDALAARVKALEDRPPVAGKDGIDGKDGRDGIDGRNGERGRDGIDGKDGKDGINGKDGEAGLKGSDGIDGKDGKDGKDGRDGRDGKDGRDGVDGRDAAELDILSNIDFARSYPRGTFACYQNGLWWASRNTDGADGWRCIYDGQTQTFERDGERGIAITATFASGEVKRTVFMFPVPLYRGVFEQGRVYEPGDMVTWAGSVWHCDAPTTARPDIASDAWTLAVKRGRDGRDNGSKPT